MANGQVSVPQLTITADKTRLIEQGILNASSSVSIDVMKDTVYLHWLFEVFGSVQTTYASGSPVADDTSIMSRLISFIKVDAGGDYVLKNINPWFLHMQSLIGSGVFNNRFCETGATPQNPHELDTDAKFVYGSTTQYTTFSEAVLISFENVLANQGRKDTWLDARGLSSLTCELNTLALSNLLEAGNNAPVVYSNADIKYRLTSIETQQVPLNVKFSVWKQSQRTVPLVGAGEAVFDIVKGNYLQSIAFLVRDGNTGKSLSNAAVEQIAYIINGDKYPQQTTFQDIQKRNRERYGINAPFIGGASVMDGFCYMDLLIPIGNEKLGSLSTAQNLLAPLTDSSRISLTGSSQATYTNPVEVTMQFNEIVKPLA